MSRGGNISYAQTAFDDSTWENVTLPHESVVKGPLHLTDRMGCLLMDQVSASWARKQTDNESHLMFSELHEADLRSLIKRDRIHSPTHAWSIGNEVGGQTCYDERDIENGREYTLVV